MAKWGPIIVIEDDADDEHLMEEVLKELNIGNKLVWFTGTDDAFNYLKTTADRPFIIFCDVNLPQESGVDFKRRVDEDEQLRTKSIPFVFYSTAVSQKVVNEAYTQMTVQGFFQKGQVYEEIKRMIRCIYDYWSLCKHPNMI